MNIQPRVAAGFLFALFVVAAAPAFADVPSGDQQVSLNGVTTVVSDLSAPLTVEQTGTPYGFATSNALGTPSVRAIATTATFDSSVSARAGLDYWVQVNGPAFDGTIPVIFRSTLDVSAATGLGLPNEGSYAAARFALQSYSAHADGSPFENLTNQMWQLEATTRFGSAEDTRSQRVNGIFHLNAGDLLLASITADVAAQDGGQASAFADPYFFIDPTFAADHTGYTLSFSPFAGNDAPTGGVPEPSNWALMILGFGGVGIALRRRPTPALA